MRKLTQIACDGTPLPSRDPTEHLAAALKVYFRSSSIEAPPIISHGADGYLWSHSVEAIADKLTELSSCAKKDGPNYVEEVVSVPEISANVS